MCYCLGKLQTPVIGEFMSPPPPLSPFYLEKAEIQLRQNGNLLIHVTQNNQE